MLLFQQEPSFDSFNRSHRSNFPVLFIDRRSLVGYRNLQFISYSIIWHSVRTEPSGLSMGTEHQLLNLIFHWILGGLVLLFWCLLHDRYTPHQNSRGCFDSSVQLRNHRIATLGQPADSISLCWDSRTPRCISSINRWILSWIAKGASDRERQRSIRGKWNRQNVWSFFTHKWECCTAT